MGYSILETPRQSGFLITQYQDQAKNKQIEENGVLIE